MKKSKCDFHGWATRSNVKCADGRTITSSAFVDDDGSEVPLVWNHQHDSPENVLGKAKLFHRNEGIYAECYLNDSKAAKHVREIVKHGDIKSFSIWANDIKQQGTNVTHGKIRELSLVLSGANPEAIIEPIVAHSADGEIYTIEDNFIFKLGSDSSEITIAHSDDPLSNLDDEDDNDVGDFDLDDDGYPVEHSGTQKSFEEILDTFDKDQLQLLYLLTGVAEQIKHGEDYEGGDLMYYTPFDGLDVKNDEGQVISHSAIQSIINEGESFGTLKTAFIKHGITNIQYMAPDPKNLTTYPIWVSQPMEWVTKVLSGVKHTPFAKVRTMHADITPDEARARGYTKGEKKEEEVFALMKRETEAQTVYKLQGFERDDLIDLNGLDAVSWVKTEMRMKLDEEKARAILISDGRSVSDKYKIKEDHIRPILYEDDFFVVRKKITTTTSMAASEKMKEFIRMNLRARKEYRGSGNPVMYTSDDVLADLLLLEDNNGRFIYESIDKLKGVLRVSDIVTVPPMSGLKDKSGNEVLAIIANLNDYNVGADKGGATNMFDDFDIEYNKYRYLIETRISGSLVLYKSAIIISAGPGASSGS